MVATTVISLMRFYQNIDDLKKVIATRAIYFKEMLEMCNKKFAFLIL